MSGVCLLLALFTGCPDLPVRAAREERTKQQVARPKTNKGVEFHLGDTKTLSHRESARAALKATGVGKACRMHLIKIRGNVPPNLQSLSMV